MTESAPIMSMALSPDNSFILVNLASHTIHLWPVEPLLRLLDAKLSGHPAPGVLLSETTRYLAAKPRNCCPRKSGWKKTFSAFQTATCHRLSTFQNKLKALVGIQHGNLKAVRTHSCLRRLIGMQRMLSEHRRRRRWSTGWTPTGSRASSSAPALAAPTQPL